MNNLIKKSLIGEDAEARVMRSKKGFSTFTYSMDEGEFEVVGMKVDGKVMFKVTGEKEAYQLKGKRFFQVEDINLIDPRLNLEVPKPEVPKPEIPKPEIPKPEAKKVVVNKGGMVEQLDYKGNIELLPAALYVNKIMCDNLQCGNYRYVKNSDMFQVKYCKPCTVKMRNKRRGKR